MSKNFMWQIEALIGDFSSSYRCATLHSESLHGIGLSGCTFWKRRYSER